LTVSHVATMARIVDIQIEPSAQTTCGRRSALDLDDGCVAEWLADEGLIRCRGASFETGDPAFALAKRSVAEMILAGDVLDGIVFRYIAGAKG